VQGVSLCMRLEVVVGLEWGDRVDPGFSGCQARTRNQNTPHPLSIPAPSWFPSPQGGPTQSM
jgi:hypothetical protein